MSRRAGDVDFQGMPMLPLSLPGRALLIVAAGLASIAFSTGPATAAPPVTLRYTSYGIPHVEASDLEGAGFGLGYAFARDNLCLTLEMVLTLAGERSSAFGEDGTYRDAHLGPAPVRNLDSDFFMRLTLTPSTIASFRSQMSADARALVSGYVLGFNRYLADVSPGERPAACRNAPWVRPMTEDDLYRRIQHIAILQSTFVYLQAVVAAEPPAASGPAAAADVAVSRSLAAGSNMAAFGRRTTANGRGLSFSNPHFPWTGPQRLYAAQLTVPGQLDVFGAMLYGTPFILLGFNRDVGWSITYSTNQRMSLHQLELEPGSPTRYRVDGVPRDMLSVEVSVPALTASGTQVTRTRRFYMTNDGPIISNKEFAWTEQTAFVLRDANRLLGRWPDQFLAFARARQVRDFRESSARIHGIPYSNVTAADRQGDVYYGNFSTAINLPDADLQRCLVPDSERWLREQLVLVLDGARADCRWREDGDAIDPALLPARRAPWVIRDDYVLNANDSHWLVNADPATALEGFDRVVGPERAQLGDRTRTGLRLVDRRLRGIDGLGGRLVSPDTLLRMLYRGDTVVGQSVRDDAVSYCRAHPVIDYEAEKSRVDVTAACDSLAAWDGTSRHESRGAALVREFLLRLPREPRRSGFALESGIWRIPFDPERPVETPVGLKTESAVGQALAGAVVALRRAGIDPADVLGKSQALTLDGIRMPMSGLPFGFLLYNGTDGSPPLYGDGYIHAVTFDERGPVADVMVSYSESTDPDSEHSGDLTFVYAQQRWVRVPFLADDIRRDPDYREIRLEPHATP